MNYGLIAYEFKDLIVCNLYCSGREPGLLSYYPGENQNRVIIVLQLQNSLNKFDSVIFSNLHYVIFVIGKS